MLKWQTTINRMLLCIGVDADVVIFIVIVVGVNESLGLSICSDP